MSFGSFNGPDDGGHLGVGLKKFGIYAVQDDLFQWNDTS